MNEEQKKEIQTLLSNIEILTVSIQDNLKEITWSKNRINEILAGDKVEEF